MSHQETRARGRCKFLDSSSPQTGTPKCCLEFKLEIEVRDGEIDNIFKRANERQDSRRRRGHIECLYIW